MLAFSIGNYAYQFSRALCVTVFAGMTESLLSGVGGQQVSFEQLLLQESSSSSVSESSTVDVSSSSSDFAYTPRRKAAGKKKRPAAKAIARQQVTPNSRSVSVGKPIIKKAKNIKVKPCNCAFLFQITGCIGSVS